MSFPVPDLSWLGWVWPVLTFCAAFGIGYIVGGIVQR